MSRANSAVSAGRWLAGIVVAGAILSTSAPSVAQDVVSEDLLAQELAERYSPIVMVKEQAEPCDTDGEPFEPAPVEIVLDNPEVFLRQVGNDDPVAMRGPGAADIFDLQEGWYLDFPGDAVDPRCIFETDYGRFSADLPSVVYAHVATEVGRPGMLGLQYWFFWYHNPSKNDHEGDWEFVQLLFEVGTAEEALGTDPIEVGMAQHIGGERADWNDDRIEKDGSRLIVYPARGAHASYFNQEVYLGRSDEFFGCDDTTEPSRRVDTEVVLLPHEVTDRNDEFAWLSFKGRWGQREPGFLNGPTGPAEKARWNEPITWHEGLRDASVVIPQGERFGGVVTAFCSVVEAGSTVVVKAVREPVVVLLLLGLIGYLLLLFFRQTTWSPVTTQPLRARRAAGQILRSSLRFAGQRPFILLAIGLVAIPVSLATSLLQALVQQIPLARDLLSLAGERSETGVGLALLIGGVGSSLSYAIIAGAVAAVIDQPHPSRASWRTAIGPLLSAFVRAAGIVVALFITVVGLPWAIRQLVRYQLVPQAVVLEGAGGKDALGRSSELVRGRWWWTATVFAVLQFVIGIVGMLLALALLVAFPGVPLWLFGIFSSVAFVLLMPIFGAVMAFVYGEHIARREARSTAPAAKVAT